MNGVAAELVVFTSQKSLNVVLAVVTNSRTSLAKGIWLIESNYHFQYGMAAALVDQNELSTLRVEWADILAAIKNKEDRFIAPKVRALAINMEKRMKYADPELSEFLTINQISTEITRVFRSYKIPIAPWVSEYFHGKDEQGRDWSRFLDPKQQSNSLYNRSVSPSQYGGIEPSLLIEDLSALPADEIKKLPNSVKIMLYDTIMKNKNLIESDALEQHYQLNDKQQRDPIRTSKPFAPRITKLGEAFRYLGQTYIDFGNWIDTEFPPPPELEERWSTGPVTVASMYKNLMNVKYSLTDIQWLERDVYRIHQSKHGAAVKDKVETLLCKRCTKLNSEKYEPGDFVEMEYDKASPTNWRCPECGGTEGVKRGLTREQCGDKALQSCPSCGYHLKWEQGLSPIETRAIELGNGLEIWNEVTTDFYLTIPQKCIGVRKTKLGKDLSDKA